MKPILFKLLGRASDLVDVQPIIALVLGGALLAVFLTALRRSNPAVEPEPKPSLIWTLYRQFSRLLWAAMLAAFLVGSLSVLRVYLHQTLAGFQRTHGRITEANYNAVQTIWGAEQAQGDLRPELFYEEEVTERIEFEDLTKPAVLRKKMVRHDITANPFLFARHEVTLRQNARRKGSALYGGYETACRFTWRLKNPAERDVNSVLKFPLPAAGAMYDGLAATLNGKDILPEMQLKDGALLLTRDWKAGETLDLAMAFKSRGMSVWYFQVKDPREIRDFTLTLNLPDLPKARMNNPEGCMAPTAIKATADNQGMVLTYRLDHAISSKGMGIAFPTPPQPGATTNAVLAEVERGWLLLFAMVILGLTLATVPHAVLVSILFGAATACAYGLLADFSDLLLGFWATAGLLLLPMFGFLAWLLARVVGAAAGKWLAFQLLLFGILYPSLAGLDADRQTLYFNLCALVFLALAAWQLLRRLSGRQTPASQPTPERTATQATESPAPGVPIAAPSATG
jgi:hypothetical protein